MRRINSQSKDCITCDSSLRGMTLRTGSCEDFGAPLGGTATTTGLSKNAKEYRTSLRSCSYKNERSSGYA